MILTEEFLNKVLNYFDSDLADECKTTDQFTAKTERIDDTHLVISITLKEDLNKKKFDKFIDNCSAFQWEYILNNFERITGKSLNDINTLYKNKQYDVVLQLFNLVIESLIEEFKDLVNKK